MPDRKHCEEPECGNDMPVSMQHCPHCGRPRLFPNVDVARLPSEVRALRNRFDAAKNDAAQRGAEAKLQAFQTAVELSKAVIAYPFSEVHRLARSDNELATTFYSMGATTLKKGSHVLLGPKWDSLRPVAETAMFGDENKRDIHFAALSLDDEGLSNYGECSVTLRTPLVAHRTSAFEENMLLFFKTKCKDYWKAERIPSGFRSDWSGRSMLAAAKLGSRILVTTADAEFPKILLTRGVTSAQDQFIELHVCGFMTARTFEKVVLTRRKGLSRTLLRATQADLKKRNVTWSDLSTTP